MLLPHCRYASSDLVVLAMKKTEELEVDEVFRHRKLHTADGRLMLCTLHPDICYKQLLTISSGKNAILVQS